MFNLAGNRPLLPAAMIAALFVTGACIDDTVDPAAVAAALAGNTVEPDSVPPSMATYSAPGSNWQYDFYDDGTYSITRSDNPGMESNLSVDGGYQTTATGFVSMTVDSSTGTDAPSVGGQIWALEVPGYALVLSPVSTSEDNFIPMVVGNQCPGTDFNNNWITVRPQSDGDSTSADGSYFGSMSYRHTNGFTNLSTQFALTAGNPDQGTMELGTGYCRDGIVATASSDIYVAPEGSATIRANIDEANEQTIFALPKTTIGSIGSLDGSYAGVLSDDGADLANKVSPVLVTCNSGTCTGDIITDLAAGTLAGQPFVVDLSGSTNVPGQGLTTGQFQAGGGSSNLGCMVNIDYENNGQRMIGCAGQSPTMSYRLLNLILVSNN